MNPYAVRFLTKNPHTELKPSSNWANQVVKEILPTHDISPTRWLAIDSNKDLERRVTDYAHVVIDVPDSKQCVVSDFPTWLSLEQHTAIKLLLAESKNQHFGIISADLAIFLFRVPAGAATGRLLILGLELVSLVIKELFPSALLTRSEFLTLLQLTMGYSLKEAAAVDNLGYETKRSQLKAVFLKTRTTKQSEITSILLSHLLVNFGAKDHRCNNDNLHKTFYHYVDECLPKNTRKHIVINEDGSHSRFLDFGSVLGSPMILLHHLAGLYFSESQIKLLELLDLRLICPLRNGALGPRDKPLLFDDHMAHARASIECARRMFCEDQLTLVCPNSSCFYGMDYIQAYPSAVKNIIIVGANYKYSPQRTAAETFRDYFYGIALRNIWLLNKLVKYLIDNSEEPGIFFKLFTKAYADSPIDSEFLERAFSDPEFSYAFDFRLRCSLTSAQHDLYLQAKQDWTAAATIEADIHFIHGKEDKIHSIEHIDDLTKTLENGTLHPMELAGGFILEDHLSGCLKIIKGIISSEKPEYLRLP